LFEVMPKDNLCRFNLPSTKAPALVRLSTISASRAGRWLLSALVPAVVGKSFVPMASFIAMGRPCRGPSGVEQSQAFARFSARSSSSLIKASSAAFSVQAAINSRVYFSAEIVLSAIARHVARALQNLISFGKTALVSCLYIGVK